MKNIIILLFIIQLSNITYCQCNCQTFTKNGLSALQCPLTPIAGDKSLQVGIGLAKSGDINFISVAIRFKTIAENVTNNLSLTLTDGTMIELPLYQSKLGYVGNNQVGGGNYILDESNLQLLKKVPIRSISFYLEDNLEHLLMVQTNSRIIINQIKCL